jgi:hypothetical protein
VHTSLSKGSPLTLRRRLIINTSQTRSYSYSTEIELEVEVEVEASGYEDDGQEVRIIVEQGAQSPVEIHSVS